MQVIVFVGGGTGGHVYPGLAVIEALSQRGQFRFVWVGSHKGIERRLIKEVGLEYRAIRAGKFRRYWSLKNVSDFFWFLLGLIQSFQILKKLCPIFVFSKGGFVSVPLVWASRVMKIPVFSHESDLDPGLATKLNLPCSQKMFVPYPDSFSFYPSRYQHKLVVTGNPVRQALFSLDRSYVRRVWQVPSGIPVILILGGSLGAKQLNDLVKVNRRQWEGRFFVVHQTGEGVAAEQTPWYVSAPYFQELNHLYAGADLLISRAGAGTLWEAATVGLAMILIPLSQGSRGDQIRNARLFARTGAATVLEGRVSAFELYQAVETFFAQPEGQARVTMTLAAFRANQSAAFIVDQIASTFPSLLT